MTAITMTGDLNGAHRLVILTSLEGAYLFVFETASSGSPERDYLQDSVEDAQAQAEEEFGAPAEGWEPWKGPSLV